MISTISFSVFCVLFTTSLAVRRDSVWTIRMTPSDAEGANTYEGPVELLAVFADGKQHSITLPSTQYAKGDQEQQPITFRVGMSSPGPLQMAYVRTRGVCAMGLLPLTVLRLKQIELVSEDTNTTYNKFVDDLAVKDACQSNRSLGTAIKDFDEFNPAYCLVDGKKYTDGEQVEMGCIAKCTCMRGVLGCVDMCPTASWSADRKCHYVHLPGQCCDAIRCEEDEAMNSCTSTVPKYETDDNRQKGPVRRYPWSALVCTDPKCSQVYGGVIVGSRHVLMFSPDLSIFTELRITTGQYIAPSVNGSDFSPLRVVNSTTHSDFVNPDSPIADSASRLHLLQLDQPLMFNTKTQAANLPFTKEQCAQLSSQECPVMTVGWDRTDDEDQTADIRQWFLHAEKSALTNDLACSPNATGRHPRMVAPRRRGDRRSCLNGLSRDDCTGPLGGAIVSTRGAVDFLVGMLDPDSALFSCESQGTASVLPLCKYTEWISSVITAGNF